MALLTVETINPDVVILMWQVSAMQDGKHPQFLNVAGWVLPDGYRLVGSPGDVRAAVDGGLLVQDQAGAVRITPHGKGVMETLGAAIKAAFAKVQ